MPVGISVHSTDEKRLPKQRRNILILNGPNLNMLGVREPDVYGSQSLKDIEKACESHAGDLGLAVKFQQNNIEGELVTIIQQARGKFDGIIINPGAYAHTSIAIADALRILEVPIIEVHLTNTFKRESYRHRSYVAEVARGVITGLGGHGYLLALSAIRTLIEG
jgi:3-dehydroquinate dehydratase-2